MEKSQSPGYCLGIMSELLLKERQGSDLSWRQASRESEMQVRRKWTGQTANKPRLQSRGFRNKRDRAGAGLTLGDQAHPVWLVLTLVTDCSLWLGNQKGHLSSSLTLKKNVMAYGKLHAMDCYRAHETEASFLFLLWKFPDWNILVSQKKLWENQPLVQLFNLCLSEYATHARDYLKVRTADYFQPTSPSVWLSLPCCTKSWHPLLT